MNQYITTSICDGILSISLNRPDKKNALTAKMYDELTRVLLDADCNPDVGVVVISGAGNDFTAGNDLQDFLNNPPKNENSAVVRFLKALTQINVPLVAAVEGHAVGIGTTMLLHCDFVYVSETATLSLPFINLGLVPEAGSSMLLPRMAGHQKAAELLMLGEPFSPAVAKEIGLANEVCKPDKLQQTAMETAQKLAAKPRIALRQTKSLMRQDFESVAKRIDREVGVFVERLVSPEAKEAFTAFKERRKPDFSRIDKK